MPGDRANITLAGNESGEDSEEEVAAGGGPQLAGRGRGVVGATRGGTGAGGGTRGGKAAGGTVRKGARREVSEEYEDDDEFDDLRGSGKMNMAMMLKMQRQMMREFMVPVAEVMKGKRKRDDDEEERHKSRPILIDIENHHLKDDAHTVLDMTARSLRPYNGGDQAAYWAKRRQKEEPVIEDLKMSHLTKETVNPRVIALLHDRGLETTAKQWLSSNYSVRDNDRKMRATDKGTAGAFYYDYAEPAGVWEVVDAVHNYTMCLRMVPEDDWSGQLILKTLHECRMFAHPKFDSREQKTHIMTFFDKVMRRSLGFIGYGMASPEFAGAEEELHVRAQREAADGREGDDGHRQGRTPEERWVNFLNGAGLIRFPS